MTTNSIIPYSFVPGTKAKAQEVNANFVSVADAIQADKEYVETKVEEINTALDTKANTDFSNTALASRTAKGVTMFGTEAANIAETRPAVVVRSNMIGSSWYRIWSDNWAEQGGIAGISNEADSDATITFLVPFNTMTYGFTCSAMLRSDQSATYYTKYDIGTYLTATASNMKIKIRSTHKRVLWYACGYLPENY